MLKGLYRCYLSPDSQIDKLFKVNASESARGVRFILNDFRELEKLSFHQKVYNGYKDIISKNPGRFVVVDGNGSIDDIHGRVRNAVLDICEIFLQESM